MPFFGGSVGQGYFQGVDQFLARQLQELKVKQAKQQAQKEAEQQALRGPASNALFALLSGQGGGLPNGAPQAPAPVAPPPGTQSQPMGPPPGQPQGAAAPSPMQPPAVPGGMPSQVPGMAPPDAQPRGVGMGPIMGLPTATRPGGPDVAQSVLQLLQQDPDNRADDVDRKQADVVNAQEAGTAGPARAGMHAPDLPPVTALPPYRGIPEGPPQPGGTAAPPAPPQMPEGPPPGPLTARKPEGIHLPDIAKSLVAAGVPKEHLIDALELLNPVMNQANQEEMQSIKLQHQLAQDTIKFQEMRIKELTEGRKTKEGEQKHDLAVTAEERKAEELEAKKKKMESSEDRLNRKLDLQFGPEGTERKKVDAAVARSKAYADHVRAADKEGTKVVPPETVDFYAKQSLAGDNSWQVGLARGQSGRALISAVKDRIPAMAGEMSMTPQDVSTNKATREATNKALTDRTKYVAAATQFISNFQKQADLVEKYLEPGLAGGVPAFNRWIQAGRTALAGDPDVTNLDTVLRGIAREHQRIVTGVASNAQLHVSSQEIADKQVNSLQSPEQVRGQLKVFREEAENALQSGEEMVSLLKETLRHIGEPGSDRSERSAHSSDTRSRVDQIPGQATKPDLPQPGDVVDGFRYTGKKDGNRGDPKNWTKVQ